MVIILRASPRQHIPCRCVTLRGIYKARQACEHRGGIRELV